MGVSSSVGGFIFPLDQHGVDAFQSLMLAQRLARTLLLGFVEDGGTLRDGHGGSTVSVQDLFDGGTLS